MFVPALHAALRHWRLERVEFEFPREADWKSLFWKRSARFTVFKFL